MLIILWNMMAVLGTACFVLMVILLVSIAVSEKLRWKNCIKSYFNRKDEHND